MTAPATKTCPLCASVQPAEVLVCTVCNRDIAIPQSLRDEHEDLLRKRDALRTEIANAKARISALQKKTRGGR